MNELFQLQSPYPLPKLKCLPLREQPAYRVSQNPDACNLWVLQTEVHPRIGGDDIEPGG